MASSASAAEGRDAASPQVVVEAARAVCLVGDHMAGAAAWPARAGAGNTDSVQQCLGADAVVALARCDQEGERATLAVAGEVELARQSASASAEGVIVRFVLPVPPPFQPGAAACRWARTMVESIWTSQSMPPAASARTCICCRARVNTPSVA